MQEDWVYLQDFGETYKSLKPPTLPSQTTSSLPKSARVKPSSNKLLKADSDVKDFKVPLNRQN